MCKNVTKVRVNLTTYLIQTHTNTHKQIHITAQWVQQPTPGVPMSVEVTGWGGSVEALFSSLLL